MKGSFDLLPQAPSINALAFGDPLHGWAGADRAILATRDGGASWAKAWQGDERVLDVRALGPLGAWALAAPPLQGGAGPLGLGPDSLLTTADGGRTWRTTHLGTPVVDLQVVADRQAWALTAPGPVEAPVQHLVHTVDGGRTWQQAIPQPVAAVCFADPFRGWAIGTNVMRTADGGAHWLTLGRSPLPADLGLVLTCRGSGLWLMGTSEAPAAFGGDYDLRRSTDGGQNWDPVLSNAPYPRPGNVVAGPDGMGPFDAPDGETAFVSGPSAGGSETMVSVTHDGGRTWVTTTLSVPAMSLSAVAVLDATHAWFADYGLSGELSTGLLASTADGGQTWQERWPSAGLRPLESVAFVSAATGFGLGAFGDAAAVVRTDDGGRTWRQVGRLLTSPAPSQPGPRGVGWSFVDAQYGWALDGTALEATTDGGVSWARVGLPTIAAHPYAISFRDALSGCLLASDPSNFFHALRTTDGGLTWTEDPGGQGSIAACAWGAAGTALLSKAQQVTGASSEFDVSELVIGDQDHAWAAGLDSILRTTDGGARWETVTVDNAVFVSDLDAMSFANGEDGWMLTSDDRLLRTTDGGLTWTELP